MQDRITRTIEAHFGPAPKGRQDEYSSLSELDLPGKHVEETNGVKPVVDNQGRFVSKQDFVNALRPIA